MALAMDPKSHKLQENIILKFRNLEVTEPVKLGVAGLRWVYSMNI